MNLVELFGTKVKPNKVRGKKMMHPLTTGKINDDLSCIKDKDVNAFFIKTKTGYIAIDSGYKNSENMAKGIIELGIKDKVHTVFLTHVDLDHAGGLDKRCRNIYPNATIYLGEEENKYLTHEYPRKKILFLKLSTPIKLHPGYKLLKDNDEIIIDDIKVKAIFSPGHTLGHLSYLIGKYLFVGDTLILGKEGGYCFWDFWNIDSELNKKSLAKLEKIAKENNVSLVITSHNGLTSDIEKAFLHKNKYIDWRKKGFIFDDDAPIDPYK